MKTQESSEDYLEAILIIKEAKGTVRAIDIVNFKNYSKPTVSVALKKLKERDLVAVDESGNVTLTKKGLPIAEKTYEKHNTIAKLLIAIGVNVETAYNDSCHIEHCLSDESFDAIKEYVHKAKL